MPQSPVMQPIAIIGEARQENLLDRGGRNRTSDIGGSGINIACTLALLGIPSVLITSLGEDAAGRRIRDALGEFGIGTFPTICPGGTGQAVSAFHEGRTRVISASTAKRPIRFDAEQRAAIDRAPIVVVSGFPFDRGKQHRLLLDAVARPQQRLVLDPGPRAGLPRDPEAFRRNVERHVSSAFAVRLSRRDAHLLEPERGGAARAAARVLELGATHALTTRGADGARWASRTGIDVMLPAARVPGPIINTLGAGDAVVAALVAGLLRSPAPVLGQQRAREILTAAMSLAGATVRQRAACLQDADELPADARRLGFAANAVPGVARPA